MAFPRAGVGSPSYEKLVTAWCSPNKQEALTQLKNQAQLQDRTCTNPVAKQYDLGKRMGINGTPAIILQDGSIVPGYRPAADMVKLLGL
jgi:thiol:disulfide interchange protein DsbC